ncbi:MAG TPA: Ppx/GppA phosphatase family protein [Thermoplasmata archaeon]|nr:Ppx/GppA phosphatase family protein [Thermoplasmata archaeon]
MTVLWEAAVGGAVEPVRPVLESRLESVPARRNERRVAVIDVGSNTARLVVFHVSPGGYLRAVLERKESPRLGLGVGPDGSLSADAMERGVGAIDRFARTLRDLGEPKTVGVTTSAVRDAPNGHLFLDRVRKETGTALRVLSGPEEAHYAYLGVASAWELDTDLVCDLGGGSLQIASVRRGRLQNTVSLPLGALRLTERFLEHDPPKGREIEALQDQVRKEVGAALDTFGRAEWRLFGVGGTVRTLAKVAIGLRDYPISRVHGYPMRTHDLDALGELLLDMPSARRGEVPGIGSDRTDVIVAGLLVFAELLRAAGTGLVTVSGTGIREGLALEEVRAQLPAPAVELLRRSVHAASEALAFSVEHGEAVGEVARTLFQLLAKRMGWADEESMALTVAAWMHDSGASIDLWRHARHSAYLIRNVPIWGLSQREVLLASMAAYLHEGDEPPSSWRKAYLPVVKGSDIQTARRLGTLVYVAETLQGADPKFSLPEDSGILSVGLAKNPELGPRTKPIDKIRKPMRREFELEVRLRDA